MNTLAIIKKAKAESTALALDAAIADLGPMTEQERLAAIARIATALELRIAPAHRP